MSEEYKNRLKGLLRSLFQFDSADLDFGIYRIMNKKRDEIERFIEKDLIDAVDDEFGKYTDSKHANIKDEVEAIKAEIRKKLGDDALDENENVKKILVTTPFAKELTGKYEQKRAAMKNSDMTDQNKAELFSHIYQFFSRYYDNGDFLSLRRYSQKEKYAIPYNGEEVILHWANKDQYYIKTGEYFKNYSFKAGDFNVNFKIRDAQSTTNNNKAENRYFIVSLSEENLVYNPEIRTLTIFFEYRGLGKDEEKEFGTKNIQEAIIEKINNFILSNVQDAGLRSVLAKIEKEKTLLEKHLRNYTKRNTTDYFIHKDLKGFLKQELDFYIKNEVFHLDDLGTENEVNLEQYVSRVKVMKRICLKIIDFLGQIEDFQKMLFEKKKFVLKTDYCMTIDKVPLVLYPEIVKNKDQLNEWKILYGAGEEKQSTITSFGSKSIDEAYLKEHPYLVLDTKFFDREYKDELLASFDDLDEATGGLMIKSENWQALNLMQEKYKEKVKCTYIDPPYNTGNNEFLYKDKYRHSSWLTMMENRLRLSKELLESFGFLFSSIDENEMDNLSKLFDLIFPERVGIIAVQNNPKGRGQDRHLATWQFLSNAPKR
jgi:adenine-specific DNA-methyltransferase